MKIEIKPIEKKEKDIDSITELSQKAFSKENSEFSLKAAKEWLENWIFMNCTNGFLMKNEKGKIIGFVVLTEEERFGLKRIIRIINIVIDPDFRNRGLGKKLLKESLNLLQNEYKKEGLEIHQILAYLDEEKVIAFYQKVFKKIEITDLSNFWNQGVDGFLIRASISHS